MTAESITLETLTALTPRAAHDLLLETLCRQETNADQQNRLVALGNQYDALTRTLPPEVSLTTRRNPAAATTSPL